MQLNKGTIASIKNWEIGETALGEAEEFPIPERLGILRQFQTVLTHFPKAMEVV